MKELLKKIKSKVLQLFGKLTKTAKEIIPVGIEIVNILKKITDSKEAESFILMTNTKVDDIVFFTAKKYLPIVLRELGEWKESLDKSDEEILKDSILQINSYIGLEKAIKLNGLASGLSVYASNGAIELDECLPATFLVYKNPELLTT